MPNDELIDYIDVMIKADKIKRIIYDSSLINPRERKVMEMRFGLGPYLGLHTLEEVGKEFDVTRERIRQIEAKAFEIIRKTYNHQPITKEQKKRRRPKKLNN